MKYKLKVKTFVLAKWQTENEVIRICPTVHTQNRWAQLEQAGKLPQS
jgi:hypothetical protein